LPCAITPEAKPKVNASEKKLTSRLKVMLRFHKVNVNDRSDLMQLQY
jgi:hypothetical protein